MANVAGKLTMKVLTVALGIPIGIATKKVVARTWAAVRPQDAARSGNENGNENEVRWGDAIGYAAVASAAAVTAKLITRKGAEHTYRTLTGLEPPPPSPTKAQKKLAKAQEAAAD